MKIAVVHEFLHQLGGAEQVLKDILEIWPDAVLHVILYDAHKTNNEFENYNKKISWLNKFPLAQTHPRLLLPFMPNAIESFDFSEFDVVISDSSSFAKGIKTNKLHICYCHTPTRFLWTDPDYLSYQRYSSVLKLLGRLFIPYLKRWDLAASKRPDFLLANSANVRARIKKYYNRDSQVLHPPINTDFFKPIGEKKDYFFTVSRLEPYKRFDLIIETFNELGLPLKIAGTGTIEDKLQLSAKSNIEFLGRVSNEELRKLYSEAKALIFAAEEDAGMVIMEAQACGTPVIAYRKGGALELIMEGVNGEFFDEQNVESLKTVISKFIAEKYNPETIRNSIIQYDKKNFQQKIKDFVIEKYANRT
jgi:glycosyltransferase involved in cell wall biosynthesis